MMTPPENATPQPINPSPGANGTWPSDGMLVAAGGSFLVAAPSDGDEGGPVRPSGAPPVVGAAGLLKALQQRWLLALVIGLICGSAAGAAMWFFKPAKYTAYALLRVAASEQRLLEGNKENETGRLT